MRNWAEEDSNLRPSPGMGDVLTRHFLGEIKKLGRGGFEPATFPRYGGRSNQTFFGGNKKTGQRRIRTSDLRYVRPAF